MSKQLVVYVVCFVLILPTLANAKHERVEDTNYYIQNVVDLVENPDVDPIGRVVKYSSEVNIKEQIVKNTTKYQKNLSKEEKAIRDKEIDDYFMKVAAGIEPRYTKEFFDKLNEYQLVYYEPAVLKDDKVTIASSASDFSVNTPLILWNATSSTWSIYGGFNYSNNLAWVLDGYTGALKHIGGEDALGVSLSGGANGAPMVRHNLQAFYKQNPTQSCNTGYDGKESFVTTARDGNITSEEGVLFRGQDAVVTFSGSGCSADLNRFGAGSALAEYSSTFTAASGNAKTVFNHTWGTADITGISFSLPAGITVTATPSSAQTGTLASPDVAY